MKWSIQKINDEWVSRIYNPINWNEKKDDCHPFRTKNELLSWDNDYMTHEVIKEKCSQLCKNLKTCHEIVTQLELGKEDIAQQLLESMDS